MATKQLLAAFCLALIFLLPVEARRRHHVKSGTFVATAFAQRGATDSGIRAQKGIVAADPNVLPIGTVISVRNAGEYSGTYVVADTGSKIRGRRIDIFIPSRYLCRKFGRKRVKVAILDRPTVASR
jgi:3D (Asp-Asp-Asp) domain-containing protein